jgi:magnesium transporter
MLSRCALPNRNVNDKRTDAGSDYQRQSSLVGAQRGNDWLYQRFVVSGSDRIYYLAVVPGYRLIIGAAIVINLIAAAASGIAIPLILHRIHIDPALSGAVILTTVTDVVGFMGFLGLATYFLL